MNTKTKYGHLRRKDIYDQESLISALQDNVVRKMELINQLIHTNSELEKRLRNLATLALKQKKLLEDKT